MIRLTKLNGEVVFLNDNEIEIIEQIPESKIIMTTGNFHIVLEPADEVLARIIEFQRAVHGHDSKPTVKDRDLDF